MDSKEAVEEMKAGHAVTDGNVTASMNKKTKRIIVTSSEVYLSCGERDFVKQFTGCKFSRIS